MKPTKLQKANLTIRFSAKLSPTFLTLPRNASAKLPSRGTLTVEGTINYYPFRAVLKPDGKGSHQLKISKAMCDVMDIAAGDTIAVEVTRVGEEPETRVPSDLYKAITATPRAKASWSDITPLACRDWIFSICTAKQSETRKRRIEKAVDMLADGHRRLCCFPGIKWMMKENVLTCGMWQPLARSK
jgi:hypothetical protein